MTRLIVAVDHPSLHHLIAPFVNDLRCESRRFGRTDAANPKPFPSLVRRVTDSGRARFGVIGPTGLIGMASLAVDGEVSMAISAPHRGNGHGTALLNHVIDQADRAMFARVSMSSSRRSQPVERLGQRLGWTTLDQGRGHIDLILDLPRQRIA
ncbi:MAG: GNAT family N-acetyltransferase [Ilumatobacter sp.]